MYDAISAAGAWVERIVVRPELVAELDFWRSSFHQFHGMPMQLLTAATAVITPASMAGAVLQLLRRVHVLPRVLCHR